MIIENEMQLNKSILNLVMDACWQKGNFTLRSGIKSKNYFDKYQFESDPELMRLILLGMHQAILWHRDKMMSEDMVFAGLELGGIALASGLSQALSRPAVFVRKQAKTYGTCKAIEGCSVAGKGALVIEDVVTTGAAVADAIRELREAKAHIIGVFCVVLRGAAECVDPDVPVLPLMNFSGIV